MNGSGANEDEMRFFSNLGEHEIDRMLAGEPTADDLDDVASFFRELRTSLDETPLPQVEARHLAGIFEEARHLQRSGAGRRQISAPRSTRQRHGLFRRPAARVTIAAVGLAALAAFGGAAYAGALPAPVQRPIADLARNVGLSLPGNDHHSPPRRGGNNGDTSHTSNTDQPAQDNPAKAPAPSTMARATKPTAACPGQQHAANGGQAPKAVAVAGSGSGSREQDAQTNGSQGAQPMTVQAGQDERTQGTQTEHSSPRGGGGQGDGAGNGAANGN